MTSFVKELIKLSEKLVSPETTIDKKHKILIAIKEFDISLNDLHSSKLGRAVKKCSKLSGKAGLLAQKIVLKWKRMIESSNVIKPDAIQNSDYEESYENVKVKSNRLENSSNGKSRYNETDELETNKKSKTDVEIHKNKKEDNYFGDYCDSDDSDEECDKKPKKIESDIFKNSCEKETIKKSKHENNVENYRRIKEIKTESNHTNMKTDHMKLSKHDNNYQENQKTKLPTKLEISKPDSMKHKSRKSEAKHITTFESFLKDSAISHQGDSNNNKRKSVPFTTDVGNKKVKLQSDKSVNLLSGDLRDLPSLPTSLSDEDMNEQSISDRTYMMFKNVKSEIKEKEQEKESEEEDCTVKYQSEKKIWTGRKTEPNEPKAPVDDVDCTSKYISERKIWVPNRKFDYNDQPSSPEDVRMINGVSENLIAQYDYQKLLAFDGDNRKTMKQTECFWEKLFRKVHKCHQKRDGEKWRDAFLRVQKEIDLKLKELSERVRRNNEEKKQAVNKAKLLNNIPGKHNRRITDMRR